MIELMDESDDTQELTQPVVDAPEDAVVTLSEGVVVGWEDLLYNERRIALQQRWANINRYHQAFGCPLDDQAEFIAGACVIHGTIDNRKELTMEEFMGSYNSETREV